MQVKKDLINERAEKVGGDESVWHSKSGQATRSRWTAEMAYSYRLGQASRLGVDDADGYEWTKLGSVLSGSPGEACGSPFSRLLVRRPGSVLCVGDTPVWSVDCRCVPRYSAVHTGGLRLTGVNRPGWVVSCTPSSA